MRVRAPESSSLLPVFHCQRPQRDPPLPLLGSWVQAQPGPWCTLKVPRDGPCGRVLWARHWSGESARGGQDRGRA